MGGSLRHKCRVSEAFKTKERGANLEVSIATK